MTSSWSNEEELVQLAYECYVLGHFLAPLGEDIVGNFLTSRLYDLCGNDEILNHAVLIKQTRHGV